VKSRESLKLTVLLCATTASQLIASVGMQWFAIAHLGAGIQTDALLAGMTLPLLCITLGVESFTFVVTPLLALQPESVRSRDAWPLLIIVAAVSAAAVIALALIAPVLIPVLVPGFSPEARALTLTLTRIQLSTVVGAAGYAVLAGLCQARGQFLRAPLAALGCMAAAWAILIWRLDHSGVLLAAWMQVAVYIGPPLLLLPAAGRPSITQWWPFDSRSLAQGRRFDSRSLAQDKPTELSQLWNRLRPVFLAATYCRSGFVADRCLASFAGPGGLVILDLGQRLHGAAVRVMNETFVTPNVPNLARIAATDQWDTLRAVHRHQRWCVGVAGMGIAAVIVIIAAAGPWWLRLLAPSPAIADTIRRLIPVLCCLSGVAATASLSHSLTTAFYAVGDSQTPSKVGAGMYTVGLAAKIIGGASGGLQGIALAITASHICNWLVLEYAWARAFTPALPRQSSVTP
jgi:putative peptidoglycan lipid II flippase